MRGGRRDYHRRVPLTLLSGPAHAGKVAQLLDRYLEAVPHDPVLIVPNAPDVERVERDLLRRAGALLGGTIGTFDDLFRRIAAASPAARPPLGELQRTLAVRRAVAQVRLDQLGRSSRTAGFADALGAALAELENGLVDPAEAPGELAALHAAYRAELDALGRWDMPRLRRHAAERVAGELGAWQGQPVFAYGFEDLTAAEWALLEALAGRTEVTVSLPYEPGRAVFASLRRTADDLQALAGPGRIVELPPRYGEWSPPALAHLERGLFRDAAEGAPGGPGPGAAAGPPPALAGAVRFLEGAGARATLELLGAELLERIRAGTPPDRIAVVAPGVEGVRAPLETAFASLGVPFAVEGRAPLRQTALGGALLAALRWAWEPEAERDRSDLFAFLRTPYAGLPRRDVDYLEGRLRGRAVRKAARVEEEIAKLRGGELPLIPALRAAADPVQALRDAARAMLRAAYGLGAPPTGDQSRADLRAHEALGEALDELAAWRDLGAGSHLSREEVVAAVERVQVLLARPLEAGKVHVLDLLRARTRSRTYDVVAVLGLEEGSLPRRESVTPFLDDEARRALDEERRGPGGRRPSARLVRPNGVERDRYLFYTACTRAERELLLVREAATDDGGPRGPSPFWEEVQRLFAPEDVAAHTRRRALSQLTWPLAEAPSERERVRAAAALLPHAAGPALALARSVDGWERRLARARAAFDRSPQLVDPATLAELRARTSFRATELEYYADCPSIWFFQRVIDPKEIDAEPDALLRGTLAHTTLFRFYSGLPRQVGVDRPDERSLDACLAFLRECLAGALAGGVRLDLTDLERSELEHTLRRDLEEYVRQEAARPAQLVPRRFEVGFGNDRTAPELQRGLDLGDGIFVSGKIDRIDVDPWSARGIVVDYKSGKTVDSAALIDRNKRLQVPLYMLVLRDLVGIEPLGGVYQALAGERAVRGMLRAEAQEDGLEGFQKNDYLDEEAFWDQVERARAQAKAAAEAIRRGEVAHAPRWGECPSWCEKAAMCRVAKA